jgi:serine protease
LTVPAMHTYDYKAGTSFSAPLAAGVASLMLAINPSLTPDALIARMKSTVLPHTSSGSYASCSVNNTVACNCTTALCGAGLLNPLGAVQDAVKPAAVIAAVGNPALGATVVLDGRASTAVGTPTIATYSWSQISGISISIPNSNASVTQIVLPNAAGAWVFQLTVTDTLGQVGQAQLRVNVEAPVATVAAGGSSGGGGADLWMLWILALLLTVLLAGQILSKKRR